VQVLYVEDSDIRVVAKQLVKGCSDRLSQPGAIAGARTPLPQGSEVVLTDAPRLLAVGVPH